MSLTENLIYMCVCVCVCVCVYVCMCVCKEARAIFEREAFS